MKRPIMDIGGETHSQVLGTECPDQFGRDRQFVEDHLPLALKLRYTLGMQELMKGVGQIPGQTNSHLQKIADHRPTIYLIHQADEWLNEGLAKLDETKRHELERQILQWVGGFPPLAKDFSVDERKIIDGYSDSQLVAVYCEYLPSEEAAGKLGQIVLNSNH